jgi:hypothetical protein
MERALVIVGGRGSRTLINEGKVVPMLKYLSTTPWICMGSGYIDPHFLTSALVGSDLSASRPTRFTPEK